MSVGVVQCAHMCAGVPFPSDSNPLQRRRPAPSLGHVGVNFSFKSHLEEKEGKTNQENREEEKP